MFEELALDQQPVCYAVRAPPHLRTRCGKIRNAGSGMARLGAYVAPCPRGAFILQERERLMSTPVEPFTDDDSSDTATFGFTFKQLKGMCGPRAPACEIGSYRRG